MWGSLSDPLAEQVGLTHLGELGFITGPNGEEHEFALYAMNDSWDMSFSQIADVVGYFL